MDDTSDGQVLHDVFGTVDLGIDNGGLDFQKLEQYITGAEEGINLNFTDDAIQTLAFGNARLSDAHCPEPSVTRVVGLRQAAPQNHVVPQQNHGQQMAYCTETSGILGYSSPHLNMPLPDSPPESEGSEPYSPPDGHHHHLHIQDTKGALLNGMSGLSQVPQSTSQGQHMYPSPHHRHPASHGKGFTTYLSNEAPKLSHLPSASAQQGPGGSLHLPVSTQSPGASLQQIHPHYIQPPLLPPHYVPGIPTQPPVHPHAQQQQQPPQQPQPTKKRKHSESPNNTINSSVIGGMNGVGPSIKQEPPGYLPDCEDEYSHYDMGDSPGSFMDGSYQVIKWQAFEPTKWSNLCDENYTELPTPSYRVDADKGFNFSVPDEAFVCQKKNHFQVTVQLGLAGQPKYVKTQEGRIKKVDNFFLHFHGIKMESPSQLIKIEQSQSDRSKKAFYPVNVDLTADQFTKLTVGRLHFSETTSNNMRKKGKPNPDQRYFMLVVSLHAHSGDQSWCIASHVSERIIVRASNPGQFEGDVDVLWQKGYSNDSVFHKGRVGVNTEHPDEALTVHGNIKLTGHIIQPSDVRAKEEIKEMDSKEQLRNVSQMRIYKYQYSEDFASTAGIAEEARGDTGVLAQEVQDVLPDAVRETGDVMLPNGSRIENFLVVNKDRIFMENVGAVKELCKLTDNLEIRIDELEKMNTKLAKLKRYDSLKSTVSTRSGSSMSTVRGGVSSSRRKPDQRVNPATPPARGKSWCSNRFIQITIIVLILIMAFCLVSITVLYILERHKSPSTDTNRSFMQTHHTGVPGHTPSHNWPPTSVPNLTTSSSASTPNEKSASPSTPGPVTEAPSVKYIQPLSGLCAPECESFCCGFQEDESNMAGKSGNAEFRPQYHVPSTPKIEVATIHTLPTDNNIPDVVVDPGYNVISHINNNYLLRRRRKREEGVQDPVEIKIQELNFTIECSPSTEHDQTNNFTCHSAISKHYNPTSAVTLRFSVNSQYSVSLCGEYGNMVCSGVQDSDHKAAGEPVKSEFDQKTILDWKLNIGFKPETHYKFRISMSEHPCSVSDVNSDPFYEYNLHFKRQTCTVH